jgi:glyoxylase-like metal-dependent hydrolase (beta-lactamase superfamily II)
VKVHLFNTGFCAASEHHLLHGAPPKRTAAHAIAALIEHERHGLTLFDTGYAPRVLEAYKIFPFWVYGALTPTTTRAEWSLKSQLENLGFAAGDVRTVIVSHLHADHIGGLRDFPNARLVLSAAALEVSRLRGFAALRHGFLPSLAPSDLEARAQVVAAFQDAPLASFGRTHDVFGDGSVRLVPLPGHARGQIGAWLEELKTFLVTDGAWSTRAITENRPPHPAPLNLFFDDARATLSTLESLHRFHLEHPEAHLVPTHCPEYASLVPPGSSRLV